MLTRNAIVCSLAALVSFTLLWLPAGAQQPKEDPKYAPIKRPPYNKKGRGQMDIPGERTKGGSGTLAGYNPDDPRPTPRLSDGRPDFSGVWSMIDGALGQDPYPPFVPGGEALFNSNKLDPDTDDPTGFYCMPDGMPRQISNPYPTQLVHKPGLLVFLYEYNHFFRIIPTVGEPHPPDLNPTWNGTSTAQWEGDTLAIDTAAFTDHPDHWFDFAGHRKSDALRLVEKMTRVNYSTIVYDVIVDDPKIWTRPWTQYKRLALRPDWKVMEYICEENNRTALRGLDGFRPTYSKSK